jgi:hypothetical protein
LFTFQYNDSKLVIDYIRAIIIDLVYYGLYKGYYSKSLLVKVKSVCFWYSQKKFAGKKLPVVSVGLFTFFLTSLGSGGIMVILMKRGEIVMNISRLYRYKKTNEELPSFTVLFDPTDDRKGVVVESDVTVFGSDVTVFESGYTSSTWIPCTNTTIWEPVGIIRKDYLEDSLFEVD